MPTSMQYLLVLLLTSLALLSGACTVQSPTSSQATGITTQASMAPNDSGDGLLPPQEPPSGLLYSSWTTDFTRRTVEWEEIRSGGPPKDGIPAIDNPTFETIATAADWLSDRDPVILFEHDDEARAYPLAILIWHEIVNDEVAGTPVTITFCPLCNASIAFDRQFDGQILDFGTTGLLRNSDLVMYDRQTETWWQQFTGQGIVGEYAGRQLSFLSSQVISFGDLRNEFPDATVLARPSAPRSYGDNPYVNYDSTQGRPFLYSGELDDRLDSTARVAGIEINGVVMAYPFSTLAEAGVINDTVSETPLVVFHKRGMASALDARTISEGKDIGSVGVFERRVDEQTLTFTANNDGTFRDEETGTVWNILGEAVSGPLEGKRLMRILAFDHFWFAWVAFYPQTGLYGE